MKDLFKFFLYFSLMQFTNSAIAQRSLYEIELHSYSAIRLCHEMVLIQYESNVKVKMDFVLSEIASRGIEINECNEAKNSLSSYLKNYISKFRLDESRTKDKGDTLITQELKALRDETERIKLELMLQRNNSSEDPRVWREKRDIRLRFN